MCVSEFWVGVSFGLESVLSGNEFWVMSDFFGCVVFWVVVSFGCE